MAMATQTLGAHRRSPSFSYPLIPSSPTFSNPDMILPDYDCRLPVDHTHNAWAAQFNATANAPPFFVQPSLLLPSTQHIPFDFATGPTTPILYGNGTMLSDIGEVTEVESTADGHGFDRQSWHTLVPPSGGRPRAVSDWSNEGSDPVAPLRLSLTIDRDQHPSNEQPSQQQRRQQQAGLVAAKKQLRALRQHARRSSADTATSDGLDGDLLGPQDDSVSVDDSCFQGDDEESLADSYVDDASVQEARRTSVTKFAAPPVNDDKYSTSVLSRRAEEILANAKKRLTAMEGNLSRARSSLQPRSSLRTRLTGRSSSPSPPLRVRPATSLRDLTSFSRSGRDSGEDSGGDKPPGRPRRSASALGDVGGWRPFPTSSQSVDALVGRPDRVTGLVEIPHHHLNRALEPLNEADVCSVDHMELSNSRANTFGGMMDDGDKCGSTSVTQVRHLKDQMEGLKEKLSCLKEQARTDSMQRRSLVNHGTSSAFTHARWDQGYVGDGSTGEKAEDTESNSLDLDGLRPLESSDQGDEQDGQTTPTIASFGDVRIPPDLRRSSKSCVDERDLFEGFSQSGETDDEKTDEIGQPMVDDSVDVITDMRHGDQVQEVTSDDEGQGASSDEEGSADETFDSESGESFYHDAAQLSVSHEDREDAFDYEHFFLHSALGTISQQRLSRRERAGSCSSEDSIETTRPIQPVVSISVNQIDADEGDIGNLKHRHSVTSISTMDSFITADEGLSSDGAEEAERFIDEGSSLNYATAKWDLQQNDPLPSTAPITPTLDDAEGRKARASLQRLRDGTFPHWSSVASFESIGTRRSFPLVNRPNGPEGGIPTPRGSPDHAELKLMRDELVLGSEVASGLETLSPEDRMLVEQLVESLGRCVLGLTEAGRPGSETRLLRRRIDSARRALEGLGSEGQVWPL